MSGSEPFELGLVAAGAVSAGAFTAGVLDLLFEAMDAFEAAQDAQDPAAPQVPTHQVALRAMVGASAGAMNAATVAAWANRGFEPMNARTVADPEARRRNPFAWAWIDQPDIARLLDTRDLATGRLDSALNGAWLGEAVAQILSPGQTQGGLAAAPPKPRRWLRDLRLRLTVGNLTGTPYQLQFEGSSKIAGGMLDHAEVMDFLAVPTVEKPAASYKPLRGQADRADPAWAEMGGAALASGAFPAALPSRLLHRAPENRARRPIFVPLGDPDRPNEGAWEVLEPAWAVLGRDQAAMLCVDGGIANNEPTDLCRDALQVKHGAALAPKPSEARQAMVMIDPFPEAPDPGPQSPLGLAAVLKALVAAWKNQARFRPVDLWLATRSDVFSRQIIAPSVDRKTHPEGAPPLAGAALGGFFGFFHQEFRRHDYLLGRHNCRSFLQHYLAVPVDNVVVRHWACDEAGAPTPLALKVMREHGLDEAAGKVPLVWLPPHLRDPRDPEKDQVPQPKWPAGRFDPAPLQSAISGRLRRVLSLLGQQRGWLASGAATLLGWLPSWWLARKAVQMLEQARRDSRL
jgi:predicted acylesterase/phospholipase RssA